MNPESVKAALDALEAGDAAKALELLKQLIADAATGGAADMAPPSSGEDALSDTAETPPEDEAAMLRAEVARLSKARDSELATLRAEVARLSASSREAEQTERVSLIGELVKLGYEVPALAWADADKLVPAKRLQDEPIADLRARVATLAKSGPVRGNVTPPAETPVPVTLTKAERDYCAKHGLTPEQFQAKKASAARHVTK